jgi:hypothetical protein
LKVRPSAGSKQKRSSAARPLRPKFLGEGLDLSSVVKKRRKKMRKKKHKKMLKRTRWQRRQQGK